MKQTSLHNRERDFIAENWSIIKSFTCTACRVDRTFPQGHIAKVEGNYYGRLRADIVFLDASEQTAGIIEVIDTHPPTKYALTKQEALPFAFYRMLSPRTTPKRRKWDEEVERGQFTYPQNNKGEPKWLCSPECLTFFTSLEGADPFNEWEPPRCYMCDGYFHANHLSKVQFLDWENPYDSLCIHCAASVSDGTTQWRSPSELAGGDPCEWIPDGDADVATLFLAYCDSVFWAMVWAQRVAKVQDMEMYKGERNVGAEDATEARLPMVNAAFDAGDWETGARLLSPIGAPDWAAYPGETKRLLAFRDANCVGTASAWERLKSHRLQQLPLELRRRIPECYS